MVPRRVVLVYGGLVGLRLLVALSSTSYIHPDEHFQNPEIAAAEVFDYTRSNSVGLLSTWEWSSRFPCRSIVPVWATTGAAFAAVRAFTDNPSGKTLFLAERVMMFLLSLTIDASVYSTTRSLPSLLFLATSPVTFTFLLRPFSNSLETLLFAGALALVGRIVAEPGPIRARWMVLLGLTVAAGLWTRVTFVAFVGPVGLAVLALAAKKAKAEAARGKWFMSTFILQLLPALPTLILASWALIFIDSSYFSGLSIPDIIADFLHGDLSSMAATPFNSLVYNLSSSNLAEHGLHPRWLHAVVNWPMLFGVGVWAVAEVGWSAAVREGRHWKGTEAFMTRVYLASFVLPTAALSVQPHQEPRFLLPLVVPVVALLPKAAPFKLGTARARTQRRAVWALWLAHAAVFTVLFGYWHQGGVVPALIQLHNQLAEGLPSLHHKPGPDGAVEVVFWRTFMPPRHLFIPTSRPALSPFVRVTDLSGASPATLLATLAALRSPVSTTLLVAPAYALDAIPQAQPLFCHGYGKGDVVVGTEARALSQEETDAWLAEGRCEEEQLGEWEERRREWAWLREGEGRRCLSGAFASRNMAGSLGVHFDFDRAGEVFGAGWGRMGVGVWEWVEERGPWYF